MSVQDTDEIRELTTAELEVVAGGLTVDEYQDIAVVALSLGGVLASGACYLIGNVGVLKAL